MAASFSRPFRFKLLTPLLRSATGPLSRDSPVYCKDSVEEGEQGDRAKAFRIKVPVSRHHLPRDLARSPITATLSIAVTTSRSVTQRTAPALTFFPMDRIPWPSRHQLSEGPKRICVVYPFSQGAPGLGGLNKPFSCGLTVAVTTVLTSVALSYVCQALGRL